MALVSACGGQPAPEVTRRAPLPQVSGALPVGGLSAPVRVVRDRWGVPHIAAGNQDDLFFAQGFVQAQDRLFQMDLWRRSAQGRLAEVLGANFIERDVMTRRMQYRGDIAADWASYGPDARAIATAFTRGVNAWVDRAREHPSEEFALAGWTPERWQPEDLLNRTDAFVAGANAQDEIFRARLVAAIGARRADALLPLGGAGRTVVPAGLDLSTVSHVVGDALQRAGTPAFFLGLAGPVGSNAWAVAASRSGTGGALLAGDPHTPLANPSLRYLVHLTAPGWNVAGATAPWLPGVVIGHNTRVAWTMTASRADTQDVYVERVNRANPDQVAGPSGWIDIVFEKSALLVKGRKEAFEYERRSTPHGVIVAVDRDRGLAYTVRWTGSEPGTAAELGALAIDRAQSWPQFRDALARWKAPAVEFIYADVDGHIGRHRAALIPIRRGWNGALPVPGWTGDHEWQQWLQPDPTHLLDPPSNYVAAANGGTPRLARIAEAIEVAPPASVDRFKALQHDTVAWSASRLVPLLARLRSERTDVEAARQRLLSWDRRVALDSQDAALYVTWERALLQRLADERLPPELVSEYVSRAEPVLVPALTNPSRTWFDGNVTGSRDALLLEALASTVDARRAGAPPNSEAATWGRLHTATFVHPLAVTDAARRRFNVGPFALGGYANTVLATSGATGGGRTAHEATAGPSLRVILDPGDWDRSVATHAPGQSERADSPHFRDLAALWAAGEYFPLVFSEAAIQTNAETTLTLVPDP